jgi:phospholipase C
MWDGLLRRIFGKLKMPDVLSDPIEHVIVLMLENRSFDHMLGGLSALGLDGALPPGQGTRQNTDPEGNSFVQTGGASRTLAFDPHHEHNHVVAQLSGGNGGFVADFSRAFPKSMPSDRAEIMKYHDDLPALHMLACNFTVCDRWFSSVPGPTWTNRFFVHSGTSLGRVEMPNGILDANLHWYNQPTVYDRLNERNKEWSIYYGDIPQSIMLVNQLEPHNACRYNKMLQFYQDVGAHPRVPFPSYSFIEPSYYEPGANDDHPTHDIAAGDRLIANVYNALRANEDLWSKTLLVVLYDEHGGFFDHVVPPTTVPPDHHQEEYTFDQLGLRVPAILVSPYMGKAVIRTQFDHTSLLKYVSDKWSLGPLGERARQANSFAGAILPKARTDCPESLPLTSPAGGAVTAQGRPVLSGHQTALFAMTQLLESMTDVAADDLKGRISRIIVGFDGAVDVGITRVEDFFDQQKTAGKSAR